MSAPLTILFTDLENSTPLCDVNRAARGMGLAYGGQILLSEASAILARQHLPENATLLELREHRLKGLAAPEWIFQLSHPDLNTEFPALKSLGGFTHNLPVQLTSFVGRERELAVILQNLHRAHLLRCYVQAGPVRRA